MTAGEKDQVEDVRTPDVSHIEKKCGETTGGDESSLYTDGESWFKDMALSSTADFSEVYSIYHALADNDSSYGYDIEVKDGSTTLKPYDNDVPALRLSEDGRIKFLDYLDGLNDMTIDSYDAFLRAMEKDD